MSGHSDQLADAELDSNFGPRFFRGVYIAAAAVLAALIALCWFAWGVRAAVGMAAGGAISIGVLLSWQWLAAWMLATPGSRIKRRLVLAWPLKYAVLGAVLWALLRSGWVNVIALIVGLGLIQAVIFGRALIGLRPLLASLSKEPAAGKGSD